jgi:hypothetical protein
MTVAVIVRTVAVIVRTVAIIVRTVAIIVRTVPLCLASILPILLPLNRNKNKKNRRFQSPDM